MREGPLLYPLMGSYRLDRLWQLPVVEAKKKELILVGANTWMGNKRLAFAGKEGPSSWESGARTAESEGI